MRISDWSSDVCSSDLRCVAADGDGFVTGRFGIHADGQALVAGGRRVVAQRGAARAAGDVEEAEGAAALALGGVLVAKRTGTGADRFVERAERVAAAAAGDVLVPDGDRVGAAGRVCVARSEEHKAELTSTNR